MARSKTKNKKNQNITAIASTEAKTSTASTQDVLVPKEEIKEEIKEVIGIPTEEEKAILRQVDRLDEVRTLITELTAEEDNLKKKIMPLVKKYKLEVVNTKNTEAKKIDGKRRNFDLAARKTIVSTIGQEKYLEITTINIKKAKDYVSETVLNEVAEIKPYSYLKCRSLVLKPKKKSIEV